MKYWKKYSQKKLQDRIEKALLENVESVRHTERAVQDQETLAPEEGDANPKEWSPV